VRACVYDVAGRRVATIAEGRYPAGAHPLRWDGGTEGGGVAPAGVYFIRIVAGPDRVTRKAVRLN
jgi:flagellar hook assembly protein FlgD